MKKDKFISVEKKEMEEKYGKNHIRNKVLVNLITFIRSLGTVAIVPIYLTYGMLATSLTAAGFFLTDFIDGHLARKLHVQSFFGSLLDGLSDKAFGIICLLLLASINPVFLAVIGLELGIFAINYNSAKRGNNIQSSKAGKAKTALLSASIVGSYFCYAAPTIKELLNYINVSSFNTLLELNPDLLSTILAIPVIGASLYVVKDYKNKAEAHDQEREKDLNVSEELTSEVPGQMTIDEIIAKREELTHKKDQIMELKSRQEIVHDLFDTEFYLEHKDDEIKKLLYKYKGSE